MAMKHTAWDYLAAVIHRLHGQELNITHADIEAVKDKVVASEYHAGKVTLRLVTPEAWPESESRIDAIGQNGNDGDHYDESTGKYHFDGFI